MRRTSFVLAGFGNVGRQIAGYVQGDPALQIAAIAARDKGKAAATAAEFGLDVPIIDAAHAPDYAEVIVEAGTYESFRDITAPSIEAGAHVIAVSVGALAKNLDLIDRAEATGARLQIANGTLPGLDMLRCAREAGLEEVRLVSAMLPRSMRHEAFVHDREIDLDAADDRPVRIFAGTAREAAGHFPRHFNVAVSLSLAGLGLDKTLVDISVDGRLPGARHTIHVKSPAVELEMTTRNLPSPENNRTSRIVAPSIIAALRGIGATIQVGS